MRLDFNILVIDNVPESPQSSIRRLEIKAQEEGFKLNKILKTSFEDAASELSDDIFYDNIDLVMVDWDLGQEKMKGDEVIREIRSKIPYKDIIFYSSNASADLKSEILEHKIDGVFCAHREELGETLVGVFENLIKKVLDIDSCRGIVLGVTSDIDQLIHESIISLSNKRELEAKKKSIIKMAARTLTKSNKKREELANKLEHEECFEVILKEHQYFTAQNKIDTLSSLTKSLKNKNDLSVGSYGRDVLGYRNRLAHAKLEPQPGSNEIGITALIDNQKNKISQEELKTLRIKLIEYRDQFEELKRLINEMEDI